MTITKQETFATEAAEAVIAIYLETLKPVSVSTLAEHFGVTAATIRRRLDDRRHLPGCLHDQRTHGPGRHQRQEQWRPERSVIARRLAALQAQSTPEQQDASTVLAERDRMRESLETINTKCGWTARGLVADLQRVARKGLGQ